MTLDQKKPFDLNMNELNPNLVFTRFGDLARKRDELYSDYIEVDEFDEIGNTWVEFSGDVVIDLLEVINLTKSLFERLVDELRRSKENPQNNDLSRVRNLTGFWLDLSIMSYLYATIEKRGVLDQEGTSKNSLGYVNTKKSLDELTLLAFQAGQEFFKLDDRIVLGESLSLNMEKKRLDFLDDIDGLIEVKYQILGEYDKNQSTFLMTRVFQRLIASSQTFWSFDPIAMHSAAEHALSHIRSMKEFWSKCTSDLVEKGNSFYVENYPIIKLASKVSLAQHYKRLAMAALESRANNVAAEYFTKAANLTSTLEVENMNQFAVINIWEPSIPEQNLIYNQMSVLANISTQYQSILKYLMRGVTDEITVLVPEILKNISDMLREGDIAYVSSVGIAYETVFEYIKEQLEQNQDPMKIASFVENRIKTVCDRLNQASHQITKNWIKVVQRPNSIDMLDEITSNIEKPLMAIYVLPPNIGGITHSSKELTTIKLVTEALKVSSEAEKEFGKNPVKEMLMRAKTFQLAQQAKKYISDLEDEETTKTIKDILKPVVRDSFLRGLIAEIQLRTAVLQYRFINRIAPLIENSALSPNVEKDENKEKIDKTELESFYSSLEELQTAAIEVKKHRAPIKIGGVPLNWDYIAKLEYYVEGLVNIVKSVIHAINASSLETDDIDDAVTNWDEAKTLAFSSADIVAKANIPEADQLAQQVYALAQTYYDFENTLRDRKKPKDFPTEGVVELISSMLMGL